jgi:hypothetical protein
MLVACPECERRVSDRAAACPDCGFPVSEHFAAERAKAAVVEARKTRREIGEVDCAACDARGFRTFTETFEGRSESVFEWCTTCEHTGRTALVEASDGFFAVARGELARFLAGEIDADAQKVHHLGTERPAGFRYPEAGPRVSKPPEPS